MITLSKGLTFAAWPVRAVSVPIGPDAEPPPFLSPGEWGDLRSLRVEKRRCEWMAGRVAAKLAVAGLSPSRVRGARDLAKIECRASRASPPAVRVRGRSSSCLVSISHSGRRAVAIAADPSRFAAVGVDVQDNRAIPERGRRYFLRRDEKWIFRRVGPLAFWSLKEAAYKALGPRDGVALTEIRIEAVAGKLRASWQGRARALAARRRLGPARLGLSRTVPGCVIAWSFVEA